MSGYYGQEIDTFGPHEGTEYILGERGTLTAEPQKTIKLGAIMVMIEQSARAPHNTAAFEDFFSGAWQEGWRLPFASEEYDLLVGYAWSLLGSTALKEAAGNFIISCVTGHRYDDYLRQPN